MSQWRDALREALGPNGQLIVNLIPELELVIGKQPPVPDLPPQDAQNRFQMVFRRFLGVFARPEHPLALFLDDLQWLDAATLELLEHLVTHPEVRHLLLVGAYRDNEVGRLAPADARRSRRSARPERGCSEIVLAPLGLDDVGAAGRRCPALRAGARRAAGATGAREDRRQSRSSRSSSSPRWPRRGCSRSTRTRRPGAGTWTRIRAKGYTDNVVDLMVGKLNRLPAATQDALEAARLPGQRRRDRHPEPGARRNRRRRSTLRSGRRSAPGSSSARTSTYAFLHDRVQEAAYSLIPDKRAGRRRTCGSAACSRRSTPPEELEEKIFEIVNQLNRGAALIAVAGGARAGGRAQSHRRQARQGVDGLCLGADVFRGRPRAAWRRTAGSGTTSSASRSNSTGPNAST